MIGLLAVWLSGAALAHGDGAHIHGGWRVESVQKGEDTLTFPAAFRASGQDVVWGRWLWVFEDNTLTLAAQVAVRNKDAQGVKGKARTRDAAYQWCHTQVTVPMAQSDAGIALPDLIDTEARVGRYGKAPITVGSCNIQLSGMSQLSIVSNGPDAPPEALTLRNAKGDLSFVLVPDGRSYDLDDVIPAAKAD